jgi:hypothetical protein
MHEHESDGNLVPIFIGGPCGGCSPFVLVNEEENLRGKALYRKREGVVPDQFIE